MELVLALMKYLIFLFAISFVACQEPSDIQIDEYYDLNNFWLTQKAQLESSKPTFSKVIEMDGDKNTVQTSDINWKKELEIFMGTDINRSAMKGCYDEKREGNKLTYTLKSDKEQAVRTIEIELQNEKPISIKAEILTENFLYTSTRSIAAQFVNGKMENYQIAGWQELFIGSKKHFDIKAIRVK
jgi:hypothetical protein